MLCGSSVSIHWHMYGKEDRVQRQKIDDISRNILNSFSKLFIRNNIFFFNKFNGLLVSLVILWIEISSYNTFNNFVVSS